MPRVVPSANPFSLAWGHYAGTAIHPAFLADSSTSDARRGPGKRGATFVAALTGAGVASGTARFHSTKAVLRVAAAGAAAATTYNVTVNGTVVGQLTTNSSGAGKLKVTPAGGVTIEAGSTLAVGDTLGSAPILTGAFA
jgi:hypothetical protein